MAGKVTEDRPASALALARGEDDILVLTLGQESGGPFILDLAAIRRILDLAAEIGEDGSARGLIIEGGSRTMFCAGASVDSIAAVSTPAEGRGLARLGQEAFDRIARLPVPTAAAVSGPCLGGGLELALACRAIFVSDDPSTRLGVPEIRLGIIPGFGGTARLPARTGLAAALDLILTGRSLDARRAERSGLADMAVPFESLPGHARRWILDGAPRLRRRRSGGFPRFLLEGTPPGRRLLFAAARRRVLAETGGHYPAPLRAIEVLRETRRQPFPMKLEREAEAVGELVAGPVSKNLASLFLRSRATARGPDYRPPADARPVRTAAVIGGGVMGTGLAVLLLRKGLRVRLTDPVPEALVRAARTIREGIETAGRRRSLTPAEVRAAFARLSFSREIGDIRGADLVIEAVPESLPLKEKVLGAVAAGTPSTTLVVSNTSSLSIAALSAAFGDGSRFLGLHFFNPPDRMPLVEVIRGPATSAEAVGRALAFAAAIGRTPVHVADEPGFLVNRLFAPYIDEALRALDEGHDVAAVDEALRRFGMPMGPFEIMDHVGLDICLEVAKYLAGFPAIGLSVHPVLAAAVEAGLRGKKAGGGFYVAGRRGRRPNLVMVRILAGTGRRAGSSPPGRDGLADRLVGRLVAEARICLARGIVRSEDDVDLATIMGMGFPPFRGGLMTHARTTGAGTTP